VKRASGDDEARFDERAKKLVKVKPKPEKPISE
jgi:hypothetical protein